MIHFNIIQIILSKETDIIDLSRLAQSRLALDQYANMVDPGGQPSGYINIFDLTELADNWIKCNDKDDPYCTWTGGE